MRRLIWSVCGAVVVVGSLAVWRWWQSQPQQVLLPPSESAQESSRSSERLEPDKILAVMRMVDPEPPPPEKPALSPVSVKKPVPRLQEELARVMVIEETIPYPGDVSRGTIIYLPQGKNREVLGVGQSVSRRTGEPLRLSIKEGKQVVPDVAAGAQLAEVLEDRALFKAGSETAWLVRKGKPPLPGSLPVPGAAAPVTSHRPPIPPDHTDHDGEEGFPPDEELPPEEGEGFSETEEVAPGHWRVSEDDAQDMYENREEYLNEIEPVPQTTSDGSTGLRLRKMEGTRMAEFGFRKDDVIKSFGGRRIGSLSELQQLFTQFEEQNRGSVEIMVERNGRDEQLRFDLRRMR